MSEINVEPNKVISYLSQQVSAMSRDIAILNAMVEQQKEEIAGLHAKLSEKDA